MGHKDFVKMYFVKINICRSLRNSPIFCGLKAFTTNNNSQAFQYKDEMARAGGWYLNDEENICSNQISWGTSHVITNKTGIVQ